MESGSKISNTHERRVRRNQPTHKSLGEVPAKNLTPTGSGIKTFANHHISSDKSSSFRKTWSLEWSARRQGLRSNSTAHAWMGCLLVDPRPAMVLLSGSMRSNHRHQLSLIHLRIAIPQRGQRCRLGDLVMRLL